MDDPTVRQPVRMMHVITGLGSGGAETMLYKLLSAMDRGRFVCSVVSLTDEGSMTEKIRALGIPVCALGMRGAISMPWALMRLISGMRRDGIQLVQCWMYHADLLGGLAARFAGIPVIWGIRQSNFDADTSKRATINTMRWCARLSRRVPAGIISCSDAARRIHVRQGYAPDTITVIPNGFQTDVFRPDDGARERERSALGIPVDAAAVGIVGRFDPQKDYRTFIKAAAQLTKRIDNIYLILCGKDLTRENPELMAWIRDAGIADRCLLLGQRNDLAKLYCAMDVLVSSSAYGEGFPNVIGEAMSCAVPCVVTDVGDSAEIVGATGRVVPPRDPHALSDAVHEILTMSAGDRKRLGVAARRRIEDNYGLPGVAARYQDFYEKVLTQCAV